MKITELNLNEINDFCFTFECEAYGTLDNGVTFNAIIEKYKSDNSLELMKMLNMNTIELNVTTSDIQELIENYSL